MHIFSSEPEKTAPSIDPGLKNRWTQDWEMSDEFERTKGNFWLRKNRWEISNARWKGRPPSFFKKENVVVNNGSLKLFSREEKYAPPHYPKEYRDFSTAFVRTKKKRLYGYFEIYCKLMDSHISSAFWLACNEDNMWTELNAFTYSASEAKNSKGIPFRNLLNTSQHVHRHPTGIKYHGPKSFDTGFNLSLNPIKFGLDWQKDSIRWFLNDKLIRDEPNHHFHQPLHLHLDSETFPKWFGTPTRGGCHKNTLPNAFEIFYVRTWHR